MQLAVQLGAAQFISSKFGLLITSGRGMLPCCSCVVFELKSSERWKDAGCLKGRVGSGRRKNWRARKKIYKTCSGYLLESLN